MYKQAHFDVDESRRDFVMKLAGRIHKNFRSTLTREELRDPSGNIQMNAPTIYSGFISNEVWREFVRSRLEDPKFLVSTIIF